MKTLVGPLTYDVIILLCFSGHCFLLFVVFTKFEVLVKEKEEKQAVSLVHMIFFFYPEVGSVSSFYTKFRSHVRIVDSESSAELGCAAVWLLCFSLAQMLLVKCSEHWGTSRTLSPSCSPLPLDVCLVPKKGPASHFKNMHWCCRRFFFFLKKKKQHGNAF